MNRRSGPLSGLRTRSAEIKGTISSLGRGGHVALTCVRPMKQDTGGLGVTLADRYADLDRL